MKTSSVDVFLLKNCLWSVSKIAIGRENGSALEGGQTARISAEHMICGYYPAHCLTAYQATPDVFAS